MAAKYNVTPGQNFQVTGSNGITYNLIYMDTGADWETGRVDIYDPNNVLGGKRFWSSDHFLYRWHDGDFTRHGQQYRRKSRPIQLASSPDPDSANCGARSVHFGPELRGGFIQWLVAVAQSILLYSEIALAPIFVGFLMVRGYEGIAKTFILSFVGISMWRLAFLVVGLITQMFWVWLPIPSTSQALGTCGLSGFALGDFGSFVGPWWIRKCSCAARAALLT